MAAVMQPPRPSMDRSSSFEQSRRVNPSSSTFPNSTSRPSLPHTHSQASSHHRHSFTQAATTNNQHSRSSSAASNQRLGSIHSSSSPYQQPYANQQPQHASYFPPGPGQHAYGVPVPSQPPQPQQQQQAWTTAALPASAFYSAPFHGYGYGEANQVFHQGFQQSQAEFASWAGAYQNAMMSTAGQGQAQGYGGQQGMMFQTSPPQQSQHQQQQQSTEYLHEDRPRTVSSPQPSSPYDRPISPPHLAPPLLQHPQHQSQSQSQPQAQSQSQTKPQVQAFHPYKRAPGHRPSRENMSSGMARSTSQPIMPSTLPQSQSQSQPQLQSRPSANHQRTPSLELPAPPKRVERQTGSFEGERPSATVHSQSQSPASSAILSKPSTPAQTSSSTSSTSVRNATPLQHGPISNGTNTPTPSARPSPLSNSVSPAPEPEKKGFKGRFKKALGGGGSDSKKSTPPTAIINPPAPTPTQARAQHPSTPRSMPRHYEPTEVPLNPPSAPFALASPSAMSSEVSLADTERTTNTLAGGPGEPKEKKKGLFRMKNMSTDNISLSSTVSSASMMIRKMGSIGKLARRNSLAGISKIFKDKPKDEDAGLPEVEAPKDKKKEKRRRQKDKKKAEAAPATVSHLTAEQDRMSNEDEDRALAGLSPAAKLARQHTLRSKAEQANKDRSQRQQQQLQQQQSQQQTGEPTWDVNTQTRNGPPVLPSIESLTSGISSFADGNADADAYDRSPSSSASGPGPEVLRVQPRSRQTVVHAVNVADHEYDSEEDSSDGETVEDVTIGIARTRLSQDTQRAIDADEEFKALWGSVWIDRNAAPKKGILKQAASFTEGMNRQRSSSTADAATPSIGPLSQIPPKDPAQIDGLAHPHPSKGVNFAEHLDDSVGDFRGGSGPTPNGSSGGIYQNPAHNSSEPALSLLGTDGRPRPPQAGRSMTVPARKRLNWAPECAVYATYDAGTYDRRSEPATCNRLTPELAMAIKQELNAFKMEMPVHPQSRGYTHYFA